MIHPRGHEVGWEAVRDNFYTKTIATNFIERNLDIFDVNVHVNHGVVFAELYWEFEAKRIDGSLHKTKGRESQVFVKNENNNWVIVHVHYSVMPEA